MKFVKPIKYGRLVDESPKKYTYKADSSDTILAPYDGVIYDIDRNKCNGFIQIAHLVNRSMIYSEICGVNHGIYVGNGIEVKQGDILGHCGDNDVVLELKDSNKNNIRLDPFFVDFTDDKDKKQKEDSKKEDSKKEDSKKEDSKKELKKEPKKEDPNKNDEDEKEKKKWNFNRKPEEIPDLFSSILLTPIDFANKALTFKGKKKETKEEELNEEIKRMKQLLK